MKRAWARVVRSAAPIAVLLVSVSAGCGSGQQTRVAAVVPDSKILLIPAPRGRAVDHPLWLGATTLLVTVWRLQFSAVYAVSVSSGVYRPIQTLKEAGCKPTAAEYPVWDRDQVVYLTTCFGPVNRPLSQLSGLATLDPPSGRNKRFRPYRFSLFFNGTFSFSPDGARGVISSGGLYSRLEWIAQHAVVPIRLRLAVAYAPSWSPDGKLILFGGVPKPHSDADVATLPTSLYTFHPNNPQSLHLVIAGLKDFRPSGAGWMPNSTWAVVGMKPPGLPRGIWIIDVSNGRKALLATGPEFGRPAVAPDGRSVAVGVGVEADLDRSLHEKPPTKVGIEIIPLPPERLLGKLLR